MIRFHQVTKTYRKSGREIRALDDLSLQIARHEFVAVRGPSGSGKSTLLLTAAGMVRPTSGQVWLDGEELTVLGSGDLARRRAESIGFVFQLFHLLPYLTMLENVTLPALITGKRPDRDQAQALLTSFGLGDRLHHRPGELSAGERQRAALARSLILSPPLILADEPTGNLDPETAQRILATLRDYHARGGTVLLVTHDPAAAANASRVLTLVAGRLAPAAVA